jgi:hypothetical protein
LSRRTCSNRYELPNPIAIENQRAGSREWLLDDVRIEPNSRFRSPSIEGYCSRASVRAGETIAFHVSTNPPSRFVLDLFRMGYYGGAGARHILRLGPFSGAVEPDPPIGARRLRECDWRACATVTVPEDWVSGVYLGKLTAERDQPQSYLIFIVRDDRRADYLFHCADLTWQAYNRWPNQFSLYDDGEKFWAYGPDTDVSFDRPYGKYCQIVDSALSVGSGEWLLWEFSTAYWLESQGYDVTYASGIDLHGDPDHLDRVSGLLSVGHDEYYTLAMFETLKRAISRGLNVAFLSGNTCSGCIDLLSSSRGVPNRAFRRFARFGGLPGRTADNFPEATRLPGTVPSENTLVGARTLELFAGSADWTCVAPDHWIFRGTGMKYGEGIPGLVGWEFHADPAPIEGLEIVASGPTESHYGKGVFTATIYPGPHGNFVFNASTCWWGDGLSEPPGYVRPTAIRAPRGPDSRVQKITANLLARMRSARIEAATS